MKKLVLIAAIACLFTAGAVKADGVNTTIVNEYKAEIQKSNLPKASDRISKMYGKDVAVKANLDTFGEDHTALDALRTEIQTLQQSLYDISTKAEYKTQKGVATKSLKTVSFTNNNALDTTPALTFDAKTGTLNMDANFAKLSWTASKKGPMAMTAEALKK